MNGLITWFAKNDVAANVLMLLILILGFFMLKYKIPLEVFPSIDLDTIVVEVAYRGATPEEVEESVVIRIEEAIHDLIGIDRISSTASEGSGRINVEISKGYDPNTLLDEIKNRVDAITTFPDEIERPLFRLAQARREVISVVIAGDLTEKDLRRLGVQVRDDISNLPGITQADLTEIRPYEVSVEVSEFTLRQYDLTLESVANAIRRSSIDLPAGSIKSSGGEILLRTTGQAYVGDEFEKIPVITDNDGTRLLLGDIAIIHDDFEEDPLFAWFNGKPCVIVDVYRVGDQNAIKLANTVKDYIKNAKEQMPNGVELTYWRDRSKIVKSRLSTLNRSALQGGFLVFLLLALFLRFKLAVWVCIGIPISFMGAIALMPAWGITINIVSLFAFILVLGIVVDDAIVTGENIYSKLKTIPDSTKAAIIGTHEVAVPVTFGVLTTAVAFTPLLFMEGIRGQLNAQIALIVIPVLLFSLIESKFILPAHLKHVRLHSNDSGLWQNLQRIQGKIADGFESSIARWYQPILALALQRRYLTFSVFVGIIILLAGYVMSGRIRFLPFPRVPSEVARASLQMPLGTPFEITKGHVKQITEAAEKLKEKYADPKSKISLIKDILSTPGSSGSTRGQSHVGRVIFEIVAPEKRSVEVSSTELVREWRQLIGPIPGAKEINFRAEIHRGGDPIDVQLSGANFDQLKIFAQGIKEHLGNYSGVFDISDTIADGKEEIRLFLKPEAEVLGLSVDDLGRQVRDAFFGREAQRIQRNRDDVRVMVRYPENERRSLQDLSSMRIRTIKGVEVPFEDVAEAVIGRGFASINRMDRRQTVNIMADIDKDSVDIRTINAGLRDYLDDKMSNFPGVRYSFEGEAKEQRESFGTLIPGTIIVLFAIYALLAIPFKSYFQPIIVMSVIPFGLIGAVLGHWIMGKPLSMFSIFGMLALSGVVVNDSLVLVDYVNRRRNEGKPLLDAVRTGGLARFRAITLTSLTTFAGLTPLIFEKSTQAQFLIPMAISLGFGVLFATTITLLLVPINYLILEDIKRIARKFWNLGNTSDRINPQVNVQSDTSQ